MKLHAHKFSLAGAIVSVFCMILLSVVNSLGIYIGSVELMQQAHMFYTPTVGGTITGMIEAAVMTYISLYVFVWVYNKLLDGKKK